jgi:hypothetical protein
MTMSDTTRTPEEIAGDVLEVVGDRISGVLKDAAQDLRDAGAEREERENHVDDLDDDDLDEDDLDDDQYDDDDDRDDDHDDFVARPVLDIFDIDLGLDEGEVVRGRLAASLNGTAGVLARTSKGIRVATPAKGDIPGIVGFIASEDIIDERSGAEQGPDQGFKVTIASRNGVPIVVGGIRIGATELQSFLFASVGDEMKAGWVGPDGVATTTAPPSAEPLTSDRVPMPERPVVEDEPRMRIDEDLAGDERADAREGVRPATGGSLEAMLEQAHEIDDQFEDGTIDQEERRLLKRKAFGL